MRKSYALTLIIILAASSLIMVKPSFASVSAVSTPEFTIKLVDNSYDTPASTSINSYNGSTVTRPGSHVENKTIELLIENQPYSHDYVFFYNIRTKGHFEDEWTTWLYPYGEDYPDSFTSEAWSLGFRPLYASNSDYTIVSYGANSYPSNAQVDFSAKALLYNVTPPPSGTKYHPTLYTLIAASDWSSTQTILITDNSTIVSSSPPATINPSENPTATSDQSDPQNVTPFSLDWMQFTTIALLGVIAVVSAVVVVFLHTRRVVA
ncbi:MAG: hypothetical protein M1540_08210 [Candidatus Bathyarchaeota archaeon]|nr:hypothetical protein [Candidatus Bathyarchaeota archaeon]